MFAVGMLIALFWIGNFTYLYINSAEVLASMQPKGLRDAAHDPAHPQFEVSPEQSRIIGLVGSAVIVAIGLTLMILSGYVRRGSRGTTIAGMVIVGIVGALLLLVTFTFLLGGLAAPLLLSVACCLSMPLALSIWLFIALMQAARAIALSRQAALAAAMGSPPDWPATPASGATPPAEQPAQSSPPPYPGPAGPSASPPMAPLPPPAMPRPDPQRLFGPAPFGIPPPPGEIPEGKYGYATRPAPPPPDEPSNSAESQR
jgi:hypothetical protein